MKDHGSGADALIDDDDSTLPPSDSNSSEYISEDESPIQQPATDRLQGLFMCNPCTNLVDYGDTDVSGDPGSSFDSKGILDSCSPMDKSSHSTSSSQSGTLIH